MKTLVAVGALLMGTLVVLAQSPATKAPASQEPAAAAKLDPAKEQDIRDLLELTGSKDLVMQVLDASLEQMRANFARALPQNDRGRKFADAFAEKFKSKLNADSFIDRMVPIYDKYFNEDDIKGLLKFYGTPLGQRAIKALPQITRESQAIGIELGRKAAAETIEELKNEYSDILSPEKPAPDKN
ncbi:MAG TPA: DUF2059 domain-containing protein [Candidatus Acidoferrales bacterium]|nr:DUF2059 domain-containing protein [Candidatus Acidoferrales bacterium]